MINSPTNRKLLAAVAACAGLLAGMAPGHAAVVVSFDPAFGAAIPNLGFKGTATLDVTQSCYSLGTGFQLVGVQNESSCIITVQAATIDFYNTAFGAGSVFASTTLNGPFLGAPLGVYRAYFDVGSGELTGIDANLSEPFSVSLIDDRPGTANDVNFVGSMGLLFSSGFVAPALVSSTAEPNAVALPGNLGSGARLVTCLPTTNGSICTQSQSSNLATTTFTNNGPTGPNATLPEPATWLLSGLALAALALSRRSVR